MVTNSEVKKIYSELQKQLFYLIPEKWDRIYLYASVQEKMKGFETGEMFFYYFPKGILKKNPVNVYEVPNKFSLNEDEYIKLVEKLYSKIKELREIFKKYNHRLWSNLTIRIEGLKFEIEYNYENLINTQYSNMDRHIVWKYQNLKLPIEYFSRKERKMIKQYINENIYFKPDIETYSENIYKNPVKKILDYNREKKEPVFVTETALQKMERNAKENFAEQKYTYKVSGRRKLKSLYRVSQKNKPRTYVEQIEEQRNAVRSQILNHL